MKWYSSMVLFKYLYYYVIAWLEINYKRSFIFLYLISGQWVRNRCLCLKWISIQKCKQFKIICWTNYDLLEFLLGFTLFLYRIYQIFYLPLWDIQPTSIKNFTDIFFISKFKMSQKTDLTLKLFNTFKDSHCRVFYREA